MPTMCESCGQHPASHRLFLAPDAEGFAVCQSCDLRALEAERRPAVRYVQRDASRPAPAPELVLMARRAVLDTITTH